MDMTNTQTTTDRAAALKTVIEALTNELSDLKFSNNNEAASRVDDAISVLHDFWANGHITKDVTPTPKSYSMFTAAGNQAVTDMLNRIKDQLRVDGAGRVMSKDVAYNLIRNEQKVLTDAGFGEVSDTEVEYAICDELNSLWNELYGTDISRWEF